MKDLFWCAEYVASFIEIFMCFYFGSIFIWKEERKQTANPAVALSLLAATITLLLNRIQMFSFLTTFLAIISCILIQWICFRKKYLLSVGLVMVYMVIVSAIDSMVIYLTAYILDISTGYIIGEQSFIRLVCILISKSIFIIFAVTLNKLISKSKVIPPLYIVVMGISSVFLLISNLVLTHSELNRTNDEISGFTMAFFVATLGIEMIIFCLVNKIAEGYEQRQMNMLIELNNDMLRKSLEDTEKNFDLWRQSIHDYKNHMIALSQLAEEDKLEDIKMYLKKENELLAKKMFYIKTGNSVLDAVINTKQNKAEELNITFSVDIKLPSHIVVNDMDLAGILGNLVDNAIEASQKEKEPYIIIAIKQEKSFLIISIINKCTTLMEAKDFKTSKKNTRFHGIGLRSVEKTVNKYKGELSLDVKNREFVANILIQNKTDEI